MQPEDDAALCIICGEPATRTYGASASLTLCPPPSCEEALINEINLTADLAADQQRQEAA
jgi:hypothetical protein